jgi:hypothetical protein
LRFRNARAKQKAAQFWRFNLNTTRVIIMGDVLVKTLKLKSVLGSPRAIIARMVARNELRKDGEGLVEPGQVVVLGYVGGIVEDAGTDYTRNKTAPNGDITKESWPCLRGQFRVMPVDPTMDGARGPMLFLQEHIISQIDATLKAAKETDPTATLPLALEIQAVTSRQGDNGFEWRVVPKMELVPENDPLDKLMSIASGRQPLQVADQSSDVEGSTSDKVPEGATPGAPATAVVTGGKRK